MNPLVHCQGTMSNRHRTIEQTPVQCENKFCFGFILLLILTGKSIKLVSIKRSCETIAMNKKKQQCTLYKQHSRTHAIN